VRAQLSDYLEASRLRDRRLDSRPGDTFGAFRVSMPGSQAVMLVIIGDGKEWERTGFALPAWEHVSVSLKNRTPTWEEMEWVREQVFDDSELVLWLSVPRADHINIHDNVLHMWRPIGVELPVPPKGCV